MNRLFPEALKGVTKKYIEDLCYEIIGCAIEVHKVLGPGLLEKVYEECLKIELQNSGFTFKNQLSKEIVYKGFKTGKHYCLDFLIEDLIILEFKNVSDLVPIHEAQLINYLNLFEKPKGILMNFNSCHLMSTTETFVSRYYRLLA